MHIIKEDIGSTEKNLDRCGKCHIYVCMEPSSYTSIIVIGFPKREARTKKKQNQELLARTRKSILMISEIKLSERKKNKIK